MILAVCASAGSWVRVPWLHPKGRSGLNVPRTGFDSSLREAGEHLLADAIKISDLIDQDSGADPLALFDQG